MINQENYHQNTATVFSIIKSKDEINNIINEDADYISRCGSKYYYTKEGVYRYADHWEGVGSCFWPINANYDEICNLNLYLDKSRPYDHAALAFSKWDDFEEIVKYSVCEDFPGHKSELPDRRKKYLFFEFGRVFESFLTETAKIAAHPNHYNNGLFSLILNKNKYLKYEDH